MRGENVHHSNQNHNPFSRKFSEKKQDNQAKAFFTCLSGEVHLYLKTPLKLFRFCLCS